MGTIALVLQYHPGRGRRSVSLEAAKLEELLGVLLPNDRGAA